MSDDNEIDNEIDDETDDETDNDLELKVSMPADAREKGPGFAYLMSLSKRLQGKLNQTMGARWPDAKVKFDDQDEDEDDFDVSVIVRRGLRVGVEVDLEWEPGDTEASLETMTFSLLQTILGVGLVVLCGGACAIATLIDIPPFDQIPGRKFAALIGFLIGAVPGFIAFLILNPLAMAGAGLANEELLLAVNEIVEAEHEAFVSEQAQLKSGADPSEG